MSLKLDFSFAAYLDKQEVWNLLWIDLKINVNSKARVNSALATTVPIRQRAASTHFPESFALRSLCSSPRHVHGHGQSLLGLRRSKKTARLGESHRRRDFFPNQLCAGSYMVQPRWLPRAHTESQSEHQLRSSAHLVVCIEPLTSRAG